MYIKLCLTFNSFNLPKAASQDILLVPNHQNMPLSRQSSLEERAKQRCFTGGPKRHIVHSCCFQKQPPLKSMDTPVRVVSALLSFLKPQNFPFHLSGGINYYTVILIYNMGKWNGVQTSHPNTILSGIILLATVLSLEISSGQKSYFNTRRNSTWKARTKMPTTGIIWEKRKEVFLFRGMGEEQ